MLPNGLIDVHTHRLKPGGALQVLNMVAGDANPPADQRFSAGMHPWYLDNMAQRKQALQELVQNPLCMAIGECGLDKVCATPLALQQEVFEYQCALALKTGKPLVLHVVKAHFDVMGILQRMGVQKAVFHGFNSRYTILEKILPNGYSVSMGAALLDARSQAAALVSMVPVKYLLLETDDADISIDKVYMAAAAKLNMPVPELAAAISVNFGKFFNV